MNVGEDAQPILFLDVGKHLQPFLKTWASEGADARTVGLVERRLEDDVGARLLVDAHQFLCHLIQQFC